MHLVEVLERGGQLRQDGLRIAQVHARDVVAFERVDEALGHAVALRAAHGRVDGPEAEFVGQLARVVGDVGAAVVAEELQLVVGRNGIHAAEAAFHGLDEHLAHGLARQSMASSCRFMRAVNDMPS